MNTAINSPEALAKLVQGYLDRAQPPDYRLDVFADGIRQDSDWWYVTVLPDRNGIRAHDYTDRLTSFEDRIREIEGIRVLLVPTLVDD